MDSEFHENPREQVTPPIKVFASTGGKENAATGHSFHSRWRLRAGQAGVRLSAAKSVRASDNEAMGTTKQKWLNRS
jgi:hypothetical protein